MLSSQLLGAAWPVWCRAALNAWSCQDVHARDLVCWPTSLGWMMGPWLIFAALLNRAAIGLFLGAATGRSFCEFVACARVTMLGVIPSIVKAWKLSSAIDQLDWSCIRCFSSSGEVRQHPWLVSRTRLLAILCPVLHRLLCCDSSVACMQGQSHHAASFYSAAGTSSCLGLQQCLSGKRRPQYSANAAGVQPKRHALANEPCRLQACDGVLRRH
jgi:hypothetical protein